MKRLFLFILLAISPFILHAQSFKAMTMNIRYDAASDGENNWHKRKASMATLIDYYEVDVVGIQEGLLHQVAYLDSALANFTYVGVGRDDGKQKGEFSAIFYDKNKFTLEKQSTFWLSKTPEKISVGWDAALERICTYALLKDNDSRKRFWVFNTHFDHRGVKAREKSAQLIVDKIESINTENLPVILMGDFNVLPTDKPIEVIIESLKDASKLTGKPIYGPIGTFNGFNNEIISRRIDYIFVNDLKVKSYAHLDDRTPKNLYVSDHLPVLIEFSF